MVFISVDPSSSKGQAYAVWDGKLVECGKIFTTKDWADVLFRVCPEKVYLEDQYMAKNFKTAKGLTLEVGKLIGVCELQSIPWEILNVATWQKAVGMLDVGKGLKPYQKAKIRKVWVIAKARNQEISIKDDDIACAVMMCVSLTK